MTREEFQRVGRQMIADARARFREEALWLCRTDAERQKAAALECAVGEVSPECCPKLYYQATPDRLSFLRVGVPA